MKRSVIIALILLSVVGIGYAASDKSSEPSKPTLTYAAVVAETNNGAKIYDVRTPQEYAEGHFEGAINWPVETIQAGEYPDVPKDTKLYVYCRSGNRSSESAALLNAAGFTNVVDLGGLPNVSAIGGDLKK